MTSLCELTWAGGRSEARLRRRRPGIDALPWAPIDLPDAVRREAQAVWSHAMFLEYASAAAFGALAGALLEAAAPLDLSAMVADLVVDELDHVEVAARLVTALGGAAPVNFDLADIAPRPTPGRRARFRAAELALTTSCIGETLSVPALGRGRQLATSPLVAAAISRLLDDEVAHARVGFDVLAWATTGPAALDADERATLAAIAEAQLAAIAPTWQAPCASCPPPLGVGGVDPIGRARMRGVVRRRIVAPLVRLGITVDEVALVALAV